MSDAAHPPAPSQQPTHTMSRRTLVVGIAAGAIATVGGGAYLAYALSRREQYDPLPPIVAYMGHNLAIDAAWSPDGMRVASVGWPNDGDANPHAVHVWDATTGKRLLLCVVKDAAAGLPLAGVVWSADGSHLLAVVKGATQADIERVQVWDAATGQPIRSLAVRRNAVTWAMNERYLAVATQVPPPPAAARRGALVAVTPTPTAAPTPTPAATPTPPPQPTPIPLPSDVIEVWDLTTGDVVATLAPDDPSTSIPVQKMEWVPNNATLAVVASSFAPGQSIQECQIWDVATQRELRAIPIPAQEYGVVAWSRDGQSLALGINIFEVETGRNTSTYPVGGYLEALAWTPDARRIAMWARTGTGLFSRKYDVISLVDVLSGRGTATYNDGESEAAGGQPAGQSRMA